MHRRVFDDARKAAPDDEAVRCTGGFAMVPGRLHPDDRVHWRVCEFARRLHPTLRRSGALAKFLFFFSLATKLRAASC